MFALEAGTLRSSGASDRTLDNTSYKHFAALRRGLMSRTLEPPYSPPNGLEMSCPASFGCYQLRPLLRFLVDRCAGTLIAA